MSNSGFKDLPEIYELEFGECLQFRTEALASYRELGPPDLCLVSKTHDPLKRGEKDESSYHHILGVDASSSASIAAYVNSLFYSLEETSGWFGKTSGWKITSSTYCCYNSFSREDIRVQIKIPGGVDAYIVTPQGERKEPTDQDWLECGLSSIIRSFMYTTEDGYYIAALRRLRPVATLKDEQRFLDSVSKLFWRGWKLGSNSETQIATHSSNHLIDTLQKYFFNSLRFNEFIKFLQPFAEKEPELNYLIAKSLFLGNQEVNGVQILHTSIQKLPTSHRLLYCQANFLCSKGEYDAAFQVAQQAVRFAPSEFLPWSILVDILIAQKKYIAALLTLNSAPMFTFSEKELPRLPPVKYLHQPPHSDAINGYDIGEHLSPLIGAASPILTTPTSAINSKSPNSDSERMSIATESLTNEKSGLLKLPAKPLRGTFSKAYELLIKIVREIGWDDLLRLRSAAFVMEEEYRNNIISMNSNPEALSPTVDPATVPAVVAPALPPSAPGAEEGETSLVARPASNAIVEPTLVPETESIVSTAQEHVEQTVVGPAEDHVEEPASIENTETEFEPKKTAATATNITLESLTVTEHKEESQDESHSQVSAPNKTEAEVEVKANAKAEPETETKFQSQTVTPAEAPSPSEQPEKNVETKIAADDSEQFTGVELDRPEERAEIVSSSFVENTEDTEDAQTPKEGASLAKKKSKKKNKKAAKGANTHNKSADAQAEELSNGVESGMKINNDIEIPQNDGADDGEYLETTSGIPVSYVSEPSRKNNGVVDIDALIESVQNEPKRLCERWLDNLFMLLYEDLRVYTMWRTEMYHLKTAGKSVLSRHSQLEWEALGDVAFRLNHFEESQIAYTMATEYRFSYHAWVQLLKLNEKISTQRASNEDENEAMDQDQYFDRNQDENQYQEYNPELSRGYGGSSDRASRQGSISGPSSRSGLEFDGSKMPHAGLAGEIKSQDENELKESLSAIVWLVVYIDRWYDESIYPTFVCEYLIKLISRFGSSKVQNSIVSMNLKPSVFKLVFNYVAFANTFQTPGHQW